MTFIPPKLCAICREPFTPQKRARGHWTETCGLRSCRSRLCVRRSTFGEQIAKARAAKKAKAEARIAAVTLHRFGVLTEREIAIFAYAQSEGYAKGQNAAYSKGRKPMVAA